MGLKELKDRLFPPYNYQDQNGLDYIGEEYYEKDEIESTDASARQRVVEKTPYERDASVGIAASAIEMKVVTPTTFDSATQIAFLLLDGKTVLLNLENTNKETAKRLIDFLSGVAFALNGCVKKVADNTFAITPNNVAVSNEAIDSTEAADEESEQY